MKTLYVTQIALFLSIAAHAAYAAPLKVICRSPQGAKPSYVLTATYSQGSVDRGARTSFALEIRGALPNGTTIRRELYGDFVPAMEGPAIPGGESWDLYNFGENPAKPRKAGSVYYERNSEEPRSAELELAEKSSPIPLVCGE